MNKEIEVTFVVCTGQVNLIIDKKRMGVGSEALSLKEVLE